MTDIQTIQEKLFDAIKTKLPTNYSLVHEVSEVLKVSYDSAYRRLRNDKSITLEEAYSLCKKFNLSMDALFQIDENYLSFQCYQVEPNHFSGSQWLDFILYNISNTYKAKEKKIVYAAKDPPIFQYFQFPEIAAFKLFFWEKTLFHMHSDEDSKLRLANIDQDIIDKCNTISRLDCKIPTIEIWNEDTFKILMRQIEFYWVSGYFYSIDDLKLLLEKLEIWLQHIQNQAKYGVKFLCGNPPEGIENSYELYENEIVLNDNTVHITQDCIQSVFLTFNVLGLLSSTNPKFCTSISNFHNVIMSQSNLISQVGAKERHRFFNKLHECITQFRQSHAIE